MIDLNKDIVCENMKEFIFIEKMFIDNNLKKGYDILPISVLSFPIYFNINQNFNKFNWYKFDFRWYNCNHDFNVFNVYAKDIIRKIKLNKIND